MNPDNDLIAQLDRGINLIQSNYSSNTAWIWDLLVKSRNEIVKLRNRKNDRIRKKTERILSTLNGDNNAT
jgi:hypothetical protein